jgi:formylglycine-generating enzyme required for sulfatase activity
MKTHGLYTIALALLLLFPPLAGCSEKCDPCPDCAAAADVPGEDAQEDAAEDLVEEDAAGDPQEEEAAGCIIPDVDCESGFHPVYGICVLDEELVHVEAGSFTMGVEGGDDNPAHTVNLSGFSIDRYEVTNRLYQACVEAGCCTPPIYDGSYSGRQPYFGNPEFDDHPVIFVTWHQAEEYCSGLGMSLPTEAQWEMAARGDDGRTYPWGDDSPNATRTNFNRPINGDTEAVGSHVEGASPYGLLDMAGNVWEWTADWYDPGYYGTSPEDDPTGPEDGAAKAARGGSFASHGTETASHYRASYHPMEAFSTLGFRCARGD